MLLLSCPHIVMLTYNLYQDIIAVDNHTNVTTSLDFMKLFALVNLCSDL